MKEDTNNRYQVEILVYAKDVYRFALYLCGGHVQNAEEIYQETLIRGFTKLHLLTPDTNPKAWLMRIARNLFLNSTRTKGRMVLTEDALGVAPLAIAASEDFSFDGLNLSDNLQFAISQLTQQQKELFIAVYVFEFSYKDAGEVVGLEENRVRKLIYTAKQKMKGLLSSTIHSY